MASRLPDPDWRACARVRSRGAAGSGHPVFLDADIDDIAQRQVYRYCSLPEALDLLVGRRWSFVRPACWPDPYEKHLTERLFASGGRFAGLGIFAKCASLDFASNALWSMYAGSAGVVRLGIRLQDLVAMLGAATVGSPAGKASFYISRCRYLEPAHLLRAANALAMATDKPKASEAMRAMTMKRLGFQYENEVRLAMLLRARAGDDAPARTLTFRRVAVTSVQVDPYLPPHEATPLVALLKKLAPDARVQQSGFNAIPTGRV